jgi:hypothetical protein
MIVMTFIVVSALHELPLIKFMWLGGAWVAPANS